MSYFLRSATSHTEGAERHCFEWEIWHLPRQKHEVKPRVLLCAYLNTMKLINLAGSDGHTNSSFLNPMLSYSL
ncbi:hypothetical protein R3I93_012944 [Phoxinus phoxinus]|uniref:Uncharacterized protein n=1 Tax=Phoxinus phoxinus TaxID=58324 RepID=A0AAN9CYZ2_9TELE